MPQVKATAGSKTAAGIKGEERRKERREQFGHAEQKKYAMTPASGIRSEPGSCSDGRAGCSTGKKCLEIGQIALKGVVHQDSGFIAVVTNALNKAYFLRENDPVFNGYVVKITGDSIVFKEMYQDRLGKSFTREVTKKIMTPAV